MLGQQDFHSAIFTQAGRIYTLVVVFPNLGSTEVRDRNQRINITQGRIASFIRYNFLRNNH
jgi:hypothetical protein